MVTQRMKATGWVWKVGKRAGAGVSQARYSPRTITGLCM